MRGKLLFVAGAAVGYVLGARAGRKRYEQIKSAAAKVWETPGIQKQVNAVEDYAAARFGELPGALFEGTKKVVTQVVKRAQDAQKQNATSGATTYGAPARTATPPTTPAAPPPARTSTSSVTIAAPPDEETANAPTAAPKTAAPKAAPKTAAAKASPTAAPKKRKAAPSASEIDEADDAGA